MDYSQTAKDITKEKICIVDGLCAEGLFTPSTEQPNHPFSPSFTLFHLPLSFPTHTILLCMKKGFCYRGNFIKSKLG